MGWAGDRNLTTLGIKSPAGNDGGMAWLTENVLQRRHEIR